MTQVNFSANAIVPDLCRSSLKINSSCELARKISLKLNTSPIPEIKNDNDEKLNNAGIAQLQHLSQEGSVWKMCKEGLLEQLRAKLDGGHTFDALNERGTFGETILHVAILYKQTQIAHYLVSKYPEIVDAHYLKDEYLGETALHMTVIERDYALTEFLLRHGADPNSGRATGRFFDKNKGTVNYGEHALTFAIHTHQADMIRLLHRHGADLAVRDQFGNSVFHHCVRVNSPDIFDALFALKAEADKDFDFSSLNETKNEHGLSVLQYAVELGRNEIFDHMLEKTKIVGWEWGDVSFFAYPITQIDTHGDNTHSVLETIITEHRSCFIKNPVIKEVCCSGFISFFLLFR